MLLKISENSQEEACIGVFFYKAVVLNVELAQKETPAQVFFSDFCENSKNIFFKEQLLWLILNNLKSSYF